MKVTEYAARSFTVNGFRDIVLIGDSGDNQRGLRSVTQSLNKEWAKTEVRVHFVPEYYGDSPSQLLADIQSAAADMKPLVVGALARDLFNRPETTDLRAV